MHDDVHRLAVGVVAFSRNVQTCAMSGLSMLFSSTSRRRSAGRWSSALRASIFRPRGGTGETSACHCHKSKRTESPTFPVLDDSTWGTEYKTDKPESERFRVEYKNPGRVQSK